jgi:hypothetical protein
MSCRVHWLALTLLAITPLTGSAFGLRSRAATSAAYYYYPVPMFALPAVPAMAPVYVPPAADCVPPGIPGTYAMPVPAPAAATPPPMPPAADAPSPAPPATAPRPGVSESTPSTSFYAGPAATSAGAVCTVAFWNYSDRDVTLTVDGQRWRLPRSKGLTLDVPRAFAWQADGRAASQEQVPAGNSGMEIVIRR